MELFIESKSKMQHVLHNVILYIGYCFATFSRNENPIVKPWKGGAGGNYHPGPENY